MATTVYQIEEIELQDGTVVNLRPLDIKRLKRFMKVMDEWQDYLRAEAKKMEEAAENDEEYTPEDEEGVAFLFKMAAIGIEKSAPELVVDNDKLEEALDMPTIWHIMEIAGGVKQNNPNLPTETGRVSVGTN